MSLGHVRAALLMEFRYTMSSPSRQDSRTDIVLPLNEGERKIVRDFHSLYYGHWQKGSGTLSIVWRGYSAIKCPLDLWMYQELIHRRRPDLIVETGTALGGSALFLADVCELIANGRVISIDISNERNREALPSHPRLTYLTGSSADPAIVEKVHAAARAIGPVPEIMVILDSDHFAVHVMRELLAYAPMIQPGGYLIVEDGNVNGRPILPSFGPGPAEATDVFLKNNVTFEVDPHCERFLMTCNPGGYLRRKT
jgi:cephalosporin hydroxylase